MKSPYKFLKEAELNQIRGKAMAGHASPDEILSVFHHYDLLEMKLDDLASDDFFGTEGWQRFLGLPEEDH